MILNIQPAILSVRRPLDLGRRSLVRPEELDIDDLRVDLNQPATQIAGNRQLTRGLGKGIELRHGSGIRVKHVHEEADGVLFGNGCVGEDVNGTSIGGNFNGGGYGFFTTGAFKHAPLSHLAKFESFRFYAGIKSGRN